MDTLFLQDTLGKKYRVTFRRHHKFEFGDFYVSDNSVTFIVDEKYKSLSDNFIKITKFKYASEKMEEEFSRYLPQIVGNFNTQNKQVVIIKKTQDLLLLKDVMEWLSKAKDIDRYVAWIISTLLNLNCYLKYMGISHNDISVNTYFISPIHHSGFLFGGWWYSSLVGEKLHALPRSTMNLTSPRVLSSKIATKEIDQELIKNVGRTLLGDDTGMRLKRKAPETFVSWLRHPSDKNDFDEYSAWDGVLEQSFGGRRFVKMEIDADMIYGRGIK